MVGLVFCGAVAELELTELPIVFCSSSPFSSHALEHEYAVGWAGLFLEVALDVTVADAKHEREDNAENECFNHWEYSVHTCFLRTEVFLKHKKFNVNQVKKILVTKEE